MLFNSLTFIVFFAVVLLLHNLPFSWRTKKLNLLGASYLFYGAFNLLFLPILFATTLIDWLAAAAIHKAVTTRRRRLLLVASLSANLGMLVVFKYGHFFLDNVGALSKILGFNFQPPQWQILLPIGISFYTFHSLSYVLDVYRQKIQPVANFWDYALFVTFFSCLVAGPILRTNQFVPQLSKPTKATLDQLGNGLALLVLGLFEKCVLADGICAPVVNAVYGAPTTPDIFSAWSAAIAFGVQIFCDFAGYSTCAMGTALCLGFLIPGNFRFPFAAVGFTDFWSRWHISLSTWMRDYVYFSLPGVRRRGRAAFNLFLTMTLVGLWHGAAWTFVIWGMLQGGFLVVEQFARRRRLDVAALETLPGQMFLSLLTFVALAVAGVFFRAGNLSHAETVFSGLAGISAGAKAFSVDRLDASLALITFAGVFGCHWWQRNTSAETTFSHFPWVGRALIMAAMLILIVIAAGEDSAFIYFQF